MACSACQMQGLGAGVDVTGTNLPDMNRDMSNNPDLVDQLKRALGRWGFPVIGDAPGVYGANTAVAVNDLQRKLGVPTTGRWDSATGMAVATDLRSEHSVLMAPSFLSTPAGMAVAAAGAVGLLLVAWRMLRKKPGSLAGTSRRRRRAALSWR